MSPSHLDNPPGATKGGASERESSPSSYDAEPRATSELTGLSSSSLEHEDTSGEQSPVEDSFDESTSAVAADAIGPIPVGSLYAYTESKKSLSFQDQLLSSTPSEFPKVTLSDAALSGAVDEASNSQLQKYSPETNGDVPSIDLAAPVGATKSSPDVNPALRKSASSGDLQEETEANLQEIPEVFLAALSSTDEKRVESSCYQELPESTEAAESGNDGTFAKTPRTLPNIRRNNRAALSSAISIHDEREFSHEDESPRRSVSSDGEMSSLGKRMRTLSRTSEEKQASLQKGKALPSGSAGATSVLLGGEGSESKNEMARFPQNEKAESSLLSSLVNGRALEPHGQSTITAPNIALAIEDPFSLAETQVLFPVAMANGLMHSSPLKLTHDPQQLLETPATARGPDATVQAEAKQALIALGAHAPMMSDTEKHFNLVGARSGDPDELESDHTLLVVIATGDRTASEKAFLNTQVGVSTSGATVISSSSSRRVPVTAVTAVTADSSPSLPRDTVEDRLASPRREQQRRMFPAVNDTNTADESLVSIHTVERPVDLHSITESVLAASACIADEPSWDDSAETLPQQQQSVVDTLDVTAHHQATPGDASRRPATTYRKIRQRPCTGNCPVRLHAHLKERYVVAPIMIFHLADDPPDDLTMTTFERQLVHIAWKSPGQTVMSETPSVATLLRFCYALSAWLHSESSGVASLSSIRSRHSNSPIAIVCCANGKTRTAIAISCYLKYAGIVDNVQSGFCHFLMRRCYADQSTVSPEQVLSDLPASLRTFFRNFDTAIELGEYINRKPLLLKAIAVQGVPVEDRPCLDVWDASGHHVYSSHPYVWSDLKETTVYTSNQAIAQTERTRHSAASQWADEEGFFRVNCLLQGDFCILCRFGGPYAKDVTDTSKILFRYANSTAFMGAASPYELPCSRVDLQRRYADHFEEDDFLLSLMFDAHWSASNKLEKAVLRRDCPETILPDILTGAEAMEAGWHEIVRFHLARPSEQDVDQLIIDSVGELDGCPRHIASLALQLANFDSTMAQTILLEGRLRYWWQEQQDDSSTGVNDEYHLTSQTILDSLESFGHTEALDKIQSLLETLDSTASYSSRDLLLREPQELSKCEITCVEPPNSGVNIVGRGTAVKSSILYQSPIMVPHPGAVMSTLSSLRASTLFRTTGKSFMGEYPQFPVVPRRLKRGKSIPIEDLDNDAAMEMFLKLDHPGVCLMGLLDMATKSCRINDSVSQLSLENHVAESTTATAIFDGEVMLMAELASPPSEPIGKRLPSGHSVGPLPAIVSGAGSAAAVIAKIVALKQSPALSAEAAMTNINNSGQPSGAEGAASALAQQEGPVIFGGTTVATSNDRDGTSGASAAAATVMAKQQTLPISTGAEAAAERNSQGGSAGAGAASSTIAERQGPAFSAGAAAAAMARRNNLGGLTGAAAAARENTTEKPAIDSVGEPSLKDDSKYQKYFKMLEMGLPDGAVRNAMQRDDVDPWILDLDPKKSLSSQKNISAGGAGDLDIKNNPRFQKYFKMLKMGLSKGAVCNAMQRDDLDPSILDVDQEERSNTQKTKDVANGGLDPDNGPSIKVDLAHQKYIKMRAMGLPEGAVLNAMMRDGVDPSKLDHDLEESSQSQRDAGDPAADGFSTKYDPAYEKYYKMLKMGLPDGAVRNAMERDGVDASLFYSDPKMSLNSQTKEQDRDNGVPIKDDPEFEKYFKMLKMGLPEGAVRNAMERDGVDSSVLDLNREKSLNFQRGAASDDEGVPLKEDPEWSKYFKMIQMGLPMGAVKNAVDRDGKDPSVLDLDPFKSMASQTKLEVKGRSQQPLKKKKRVRRKKIYWNPLNSGQIKANSLWSHVKGRLQMSQLKYDEKEFADLFTESADPTDTTKKIQMRDSSKAKKSVQVIDGKRSMNGGIILARLKVNYKKIAEMVDSM